MHERERVNKSKNYSFARPYLDVWVLGWNGREKKGFYGCMWNKAHGTEIKLAIYRIQKAQWHKVVMTILKA